MIRFDAEVVKVEAKKTVSLDRLYRVVLETNQPIVLELEKFIAENTVIIEVHDGRSESHSQSAVGNTATTTPALTGSEPATTGTSGDIGTSGAAIARDETGNSTT